MSNPQNIPVLSPQDMEDLINNDEKFMKFVQELPDWKEIASIKEQLIEEMEEIAITSLSLKPVIQEKRHKLLTKLDELDFARKEFQINSQKYDQKIANLVPRALENRIQVAALEAEEEAEKIADTFLNGELATDQFLSQFMEKRTIGHLRRVKEEKLHGLLAQLPN